MKFNTYIWGTELKRLTLLLEGREKVGQGESEGRREQGRRRESGEGREKRRKGWRKDGETEKEWGTKRRR